MKRNLGRAVAWVLLLVVAGNAGTLVRAQEQEPRQGERGGIFGFGRLRAIDKHERDHETVKTAFRDVVNEPHRATVSVLSDDRQACLGCIVDASGYIVTKASELRGKITVKLHDEDKRIFDARIVGSDKTTDLAMLKIEADTLPVVAWRDQDDVPSVGSILASPGLDSLPVAIGVVSVEPRKIAAPSGVLGVRLGEKEGPPVIEQVFPDSGAARAKIVAGDIVLEFNGEAMSGHQQLKDAIGKHAPDERVFLRIKRGEEELSLSAVLRSPSQFMGSGGNRRGDFQNSLGGPLSQRRSGFALALQHDTILTPQECGGPLVDLDGRCVGINIARAGRVNSYALPVSVVLPMLDELKAGKYALDGPTSAEKLRLAQERVELVQIQSMIAAKLTQAREAVGKLKEKADEADAASLKSAEADLAAVEKELADINARLEKFDAGSATSTAQK